MIMPAEHLESKLESLRLATDAIGAPAGFTERVMAQVLAESLRSWREELVRSAWRLVPVIVFAAVVAVAWAVATEYSTAAVITVAENPGEWVW